MVRRRLSKRLGLGAETVKYTLNGDLFINGKSFGRGTLALEVESRPSRLKDSAGRKLLREGEVAVTADGRILERDEFEVDSELGIVKIHAPFSQATIVALRAVSSPKVKPCGEAQWKREQRRFRG